MMLTMRSLKHLPHRDWIAIRDLWIEHLPEINFETSFPEPILWELPGFKQQFVDVKTLSEVSYQAGVRESVFREAVIFSRKFAYCRAVCRDAATRGFPTWSIVAGYDACFYGARALCCLLGIVNIERHSKIFVDIFPYREIKYGKNRERKYDILIVHKLEDYLTHSALWAITARLCRTFSVPKTEVSQLLKSLNLEQMSNFRNNIIYHGGCWIETDNPLNCDLTFILSNIRLFRALQTPSADPEEAERYYHLAVNINELLTYMFGDIASLAPAVSAEVAILANWEQRVL
jgi:hypothetical protein